MIKLSFVPSVWANLDLSSGDWIEVDIRPWTGNVAVRLQEVTPDIESDI
jgi:hypothetical protein